MPGSEKELQVERFLKLLIFPQQSPNLASNSRRMLRWPPAHSAGRPTDGRTDLKRAFLAAGHPLWRVPPAPGSRIADHALAALTFMGYFFQSPSQLPSYFWGISQIDIHTRPDKMKNIQLPVGTSLMVGTSHLYHERISYVYTLSCLHSCQVLQTKIQALLMSETSRIQLAHLMNDRGRRRFSSISRPRPVVTSGRSGAIIYFYLAPQITVF